MARKIVYLLAFVNFSGILGQARELSKTISVSGTPPSNASAPIPEAFVSFSIEFAYFPDFAGGFGR